MSPAEGTRAASFEPLYAALEEGTVVKQEDKEAPGKGRHGLTWKLFWFGLLILSLVFLAVRQST